MAEVEMSDLDEMLGAGPAEAVEDEAPEVTDATDVDVETEEAPVETEEPSDETPEAPAEGVDDAPLSSREQLLMERLEEYTRRDLERQAPETTVTETAPPPEEINFLDGVDLDDAFANAENFNKLLNKVYQAGLSKASDIALEKTYSRFPTIIGQAINQHMETKALVDAFYASNPDLAGIKRTVAAVANELSAKNPDWTLQKVFDEAATETRKILNIKARPAPRKGQELRGRRSGLISQNSGRPSRGEEADLTGIAKDVNDLLVDV